MNENGLLTDIVAEAKVSALGFGHIRTVVLISLCLSFRTGST